VLWMFQTGSHEIIRDVAQMMPAPLQQRFEQTHDVLECLGTGRVTQVLLLRERATGQLQALKILNGRCREDAVVKRRFGRACSSLLHLRHEHILKVLEIAPLGFDEPYMLTRYLGRNSLSEMLKSYRSLHESDVVSIFYALARGLHFAHEYGVVHGGLEPTDIFILRGDFLQLKPVLADFGMSLVGADFNSSGRGQSLTGESFGNVRYMSPEQCRGEAPSAKSDIYSLGCLMFEALTGRPAFALGSPLEVMLSHASGSSDFLISQLESHKISEPLVQIVSAMLAPQPGLRPASMGIVASRLKELMPRPAAKPRYASPLSISAELRAKHVSKQLSDTSGKMLLRGAVAPPLRRHQSSPEVDSPQSKGPEVNIPQSSSPSSSRPQSRPQGDTPSPFVDPARRDLPQDKIMRFMSVVIELDTTAAPRLVEAKATPDPVVPALPLPQSEIESPGFYEQYLRVPQNQQGQNPQDLRVDGVSVGPKGALVVPAGLPEDSSPVAPARRSSVKPKKQSVPLRVVLTDPYVVVVITVVTCVFALTVGRYLYERYQGSLSHSPTLYEGATGHKGIYALPINLEEQIDTALDDLRTLRRPHQRLHAVGFLANVVGLDMDVKRPESSKYILLQPERFATLVTCGANEEDEEVRDALVQLVHFVAANDIFGSEYLIDLLRTNKVPGVKSFVVDACCYTTSPRADLSMCKLEELLIAHLITEKNAENRLTITRAMIASGAVPSAKSVKLLGAMSRGSDTLLRDFARRMLQRTKDSVIMPLRSDDY